MRRVRVLSYNVRSLHDDTGALVRVLRAAAPDLVCLQEAPRFYRWRQRIGRLARLSGLYLVTGGATTCGTAVLCAPRVLVVRTADRELPRHRGLHRRALAAAVVRIGDARLGVVSCHLGLAARERAAHTELLLDHVGALDVPAVVVAGDINEPPGGAAFRRLSSVMTDGWAAAPRGTAFTFPTHGADRRIDAVLTTPAVRITGCGVPGPAELPGVSHRDLRAASDHLPVLADLDLARSPAL